jgi:hypothetical protein
LDPTGPPQDYLGTETCGRWIGGGLPNRPGGERAEFDKRVDSREFGERPVEVRYLLVPNHSERWVMV